VHRSVICGKTLPQNPSTKVVENLFVTARACHDSSIASATTGLYGLQWLKNFAGLKEVHHDIKTGTEERSRRTC
jgi:hypothetical protein